jgi:hypothetical protein
MIKEPLSKTKLDSLDESARLNLIIFHMIRLYEAFPEQDVEGHCDYHNAKIKAAEAEERFWNELKMDLAKKGAWGLLIIIVGLVMLGLSTKLGIKP